MGPYSNDITGDLQKVFDWMRTTLSASNPQSAAAVYGTANAGTSSPPLVQPPAGGPELVAAPAAGPAITAPAPQASGTGDILASAMTTPPQFWSNDSNLGGKGRTKDKMTMTP